MGLEDLIDEFFDTTVVWRLIGYPLDTDWQRAELSKGTYVDNLL